jgi:hypothetical protein
LPVSCNNLSAYLANNEQDTLPVFGNTVTRSDYESESEKAFEDYTSRPKTICNNMQHLIFGSIVSTFNVLGISWQISDDNRFTPLAIRRSVTDLVKNTNSGHPHFKKKSDKAVINDTIHWVNQFLQNPTFYRIGKAFIKSNKKIIDDNSMFSELSEYPTHIMYRLQISPEDKLSNVFKTKIRPVWCVPFAIVALENMFFHNMILQTKSTAQNCNSPVFPVGYSNKQLSQRIASPMHRKMRRSLGRKLRAFDYSKFDRSVNGYFTSAIFTLWGSNLKMSHKRWKAYNALRYYTMHTPFIYKNDIYVTRRGVCSGSYTTNVRDTIVNLAMIIASLTIKYNCKDLANLIVNNILLELEHTMVDFRLLIRKGSYNVNVNSCHVYGDDGIVLESDDFFKIHKFICGEFGFNIKYENPVNTGESFFFLGRFWDKNGLPWQTESYMKAHIMFRTRWYKKEHVNFDISKYLDLYRVLSICLPLNNGKKFLFKYFSDWEPFKDFQTKSSGYYLLKEWPHNEYKYVSRERAFDIMEY